MEPQKPRYNIYLAAGFIFLVTAAIYCNSVRSPFIFDDIRKIVKNPDIKSLDNIAQKLVYPYREYKVFERNDPSRPLTYLTFALNYRFGKLDPAGYRWVNIFIHGLNSILVFFLVRIIILRVYKTGGLAFPLFTALFYAVHPANAVVVDYVFARSNGLAVLFYVLALILFSKASGDRKAFYSLSLFSFFLALSSKPTAVTLPAAVLLFDYIILSGYDIGKVREKKYYHAGFWAVLAAYLAYRYYYLGGLGDVETDAPSEISGYYYFITQLYVMVRYLKLLIIPADYSIYHMVTLAKTVFEPRILLSLLFHSGAAYAAWRLYKTRSDASKIFLFCILWFYITISPTSSIFPTAVNMDEKHSYLPGFGFCLAVVFAYFLVFSGGRPFSPGKRTALYILLCAHLLILGTATANRNRLFADPVLLWQDVALRYPGNTSAFNSLGVIYMERGDYDRAIAEFRKAVEINPEHFDGHDNLGVIYSIRKEYDKATQEFQKALALEPNHADAHYNLGLTYSKLMQYDRAEGEFRKALEINPDYAEVYYDLGILYDDLNRCDMAAQQYLKAIAINPDYTDAQNNLGALYYRQKDYNGAIREFNKVLSIQPNRPDARNNLAASYFSLQDYPKALQEFEYLLTLTPNDATLKAKINLVKEKLTTT